MTDQALIIGGGHAGAELATSLRDQGWEGPIHLFSEETRLPYHRPPLSKGFLTGAVEEEKLAIKSQAAFDKAQVTLHLGQRVEAIYPDQKIIQLQDGTPYPYKGLALVTGAQPRHLDIPGAHQAFQKGLLHYLRSLSDAQAIRAACLPGQRLVIIGGGYIGLELAASATELGLKVTVLEAQPRVLSRVAGPELSAIFTEAHREKGVEIQVSTAVAEFNTETNQAPIVVTCQDGSSLWADWVVAGVGVNPNTQLAERAGLAVDNGIVVDEWARTSVEGIVAAGDCTSHPNAFYGRRLRLESVPNALEQSRTAAATLAGLNKPYHAIPWFWSDQYDLKLKSVGICAGYDQVVLRGDPSQRSFSMFYLQGKKVIAVDTVNRVPEFALAKRIVGERIEIPENVLRDDSVPLKEALPVA